MEPITSQLDIGDTIRCHYPFGTVDLKVYNIVGNKAMTKRGEYKDKVFHVNVYHWKYVYEYGKRLDPLFNVTYEVVMEGAVPVVCSNNQLMLSI